MLMTDYKYSKYEDKPGQTLLWREQMLIIQRAFFYIFLESLKMYKHLRLSAHIELYRQGRKLDCTQYFFFVQML